MGRIHGSKHVTRRIALACAALVAVAGHARAEAGAAYELVDLGTLGGLFATAEGITNSGEVFGHRWDDYRRHTIFSWSPREGVVPLFTFDGISAYVTDVSMSGHVVGYSYKGLGGRTEAFVVTRSGGLAEIALPGAEDCTWAAAVSNAGQVAGNTCLWQAFSWTERGGLVDLGSLGGGWVRAHAVSERGQVVGVSTLAGDSDYRAFSWTRRGGMLDLGTLGGDSDAAGVSSSGHVVGWSEVAPGGARHAFLWTAQDGMIDLGTLGGATSSAVAVNGSGAVVGAADVADGTSHAFFWSPQAGMVDLGTLGGPSSAATALNQAGVVIGWSDTAEVNASGAFVRRAFAWSQETGLVELGPPGSSSTAYSINARGQIAGSLVGPGQHAVVWTPTGQSE